MRRCWRHFPIAAVLAASIPFGCEGDRRAPSPGAPRPEAPRVVGRARHHVIRIEAEAADRFEGDLMQVRADRHASAGKCVWIPRSGATARQMKLASAQYHFTVAQAGNYTFWCRRFWTSVCCNCTLYVRFDKAGQPRDEQRPGCARTQHLFGDDDLLEPPAWDWSPVFLKGKGTPRQFFLDAGQHVLEILNCDDDVGFDVILLTTDAEYVPDGFAQ